MNLYQVDINTEIDAISVLVNAYDENEALAIAQTMFDNNIIMASITPGAPMSAAPSRLSSKLAVSILSLLRILL